jgi:hypothetical protein
MQKKASLEIAAFSFKSGLIAVLTILFTFGHWLSFGSSLSYAGPNGVAKEEELLRNITRDFGPVLDREQSPAVYAEVLKIFDRLQVAQQNLSGTTVSLNKIFVVDSAIVNAFVTQHNEEGIEQSTNFVFVTTGLIKKLLGGIGSDRLSNESMRTGLAKLAGVIAHELSHPLDKYEKYALQNRMGSSHAEEIRADAEAVLLLEKAGYPADGLYQALLMIVLTDR